MPEERSVTVYERARASEQKFDYFIAGLTGAIFAYIVQSYIPHRLSLHPETLQPISLLCLAFSLFFSFKRLELINLVADINHRMLHSDEVAGEIIRAMNDPNPQGGVLTSGSGEVIRRQDFQSQLQFHRTSSLEDRQLLERYSKKTAVFYRCRNHLLIGGFIAILLAKILQPYT